MSATPEALVNRFDHIEFATSNMPVLEALFERLGFVTTQERETPLLKQRLMIQGKTRFLLTEGKPGTFAHEYAAKHGDGVCSLAFHSKDAQATLDTAVSRGAKPAMGFSVEEDSRNDGRVRLGVSAIRSFGDVRATFVDRSGSWKGAALMPFDVNAPFGPGFKFTGRKPEDVKSCGFLSLDHLTNNVPMGEMEVWASFYKTVYGWVEARYFDIRAEQTGLFSKVLQSPDGGIKIPVNEATEAKSQVQEFIDRHKGAGVQHIALTTSDIRATVREMKKRGFKFLGTPATYYEQVAKRVKNVQEPMEELQELGILVDGDDKGYLLQIFTEDQVGPMFIEVIQRRNNNGFGEGNFKALFEAIELDQKRRGVL